MCIVPCIVVQAVNSSIVRGALVQCLLFRNVAQCALLWEFFCFVSPFVYWLEQRFCPYVAGSSPAVPTMHSGAGIAGSDAHVWFSWLFSNNSICAPKGGVGGVKIPTLVLALYVVHLPMRTASDYYCLILRAREDDWVTAHAIFQQRYLIVSQWGYFRCSGWWKDITARVTHRAELGALWHARIGVLCVMHIQKTTVRLRRLPHRIFTNEVTNKRLWIWISFLAT